MSLGRAYPFHKSEFCEENAETLCIAPSILHSQFSILHPVNAMNTPIPTNPGDCPNNRSVGRFAPTPSGRMHRGNVLAALLAWCSVRSAGAAFLLRIEDLDTERCTAEAAEQLRDDLRWLGLDWDDEQPPQSTRSAAYQQALDQLDAQGLVYPCYCSRSEVHAASAPHANDGVYVYPGTCRGLTPEQRAAKRRSPAMRLLVPDETVRLSDGVQGPYAENLARDCGDFILRRSDGVFAYQLAVVCDDGAGGVTEVVRGADLLGSAPRQIYLQRLLGLPTPAYYHIPMLLDPEGRRLSKRDRDLDLGALRQQLTPAALTGLLACACGLTERPDPISALDLAACFDWSRVRRDPVRLPML